MQEQSSIQQNRVIQLPLPTKSVGSAKADPLTAESLRSFPGCKHYSDDEAQAIVEMLATLAMLFLQSKPEAGTHIDNQRFRKKTELKTPLKRAA